MEKFTKQFRTVMVYHLILYLASGISNAGVNNTNNSIGLLLDNTWANQRNSPDNSENFQLRLDEIKKKLKAPNSKQIPHNKTKTLINNPTKQPYIPRREKANLSNLNPNYNQIIKPNSETDDSYIVDDLPNTSEHINKLHTTNIKTNNLSVLNNLKINYDVIKLNDTNEEEINSKNILNQMINNKYIGGFSTKESSDSFDSSNLSKYGVFDEKPVYNHYNTPVYQSNYAVNQMNIGKKLNFNEYYPTYNNGYGVNYTTGYNNPPPYYPMHNYNMSNLPDNAFSYNVDAPVGKCNSEKKKVKKSKDEVDQTLFIINIDTILHGKDKRTTIMVRHIPNKYTTQSLLEEIDSNFKNKFDFFYLPMDFEVSLNKL
jgi:hypothetical protein